MKPAIDNGNIARAPCSPRQPRPANMIWALITCVGTQKAFADALGVSQAAVSKWAIRGWLPVDRAIQVETLYGVPRTATANPRLVTALAFVNSMIQAKEAVQ